MEKMYSSTERLIHLTYREPNSVAVLNSLSVSRTLILPTLEYFNGVILSVDTFPTFSNQHLSIYEECNRAA